MDKLLRIGMDENTALAISDALFTVCQRQAGKDDELFWWRVHNFWVSELRNREIDPAGVYHEEAKI